MNAKKLIAAAVLAATALGSVAAHAGYVYVPTCTLAQWEMDPLVRTGCQRAAFERRASHEWGLTHQ